MLEKAEETLEGPRATHLRGSRLPASLQRSGRSAKPSPWQFRVGGMGSSAIGVKASFSFVRTWPGRPSPTSTLMSRSAFAHPLAPTVAPSSSTSATSWRCNLIFTVYLIPNYETIKQKHSFAFYFLHQGQIKCSRESQASLTGCLAKMKEFSVPQVDFHLCFIWWIMILGFQVKDSMFDPNDNE